MRENPDTTTWLLLAVGGIAAALFIRQRRIKQQAKQLALSEGAGIPAHFAPAASTASRDDQLPAIDYDAAGAGFQKGIAAWFKPFSAGTAAAAETTAAGIVGNRPPEVSRYEVSGEAECAKKADHYGKDYVTLYRTHNPNTFSGQDTLCVPRWAAERYIASNGSWSSGEEWDWRIAQREEVR